MSKTSKTQTTPTTTTTFNLNGQNRSSVTNSSNGSTINYWMTPDEANSFSFAQSSFAQNLPNINVFSPETLASLNSQVEAYKQKGIKSIDEIYRPMIKSLQNDIATRFGNLNNSIFMDKLYGLESKRADAVSSLAENVTAKAQELVNNELANRYNYLNFLNNYQNQALNNINGTPGTSSLNSGSVSTQNTASDQLSNMLLQTMLKAFLG